MDSRLEQLKGKSTEHHSGFVNQDEKGGTMEYFKWI